METKDELLDAYFDLFQIGAEAHQSFQAGEYEGIEEEYYTLEASLQTQMRELNQQIEAFDEPYSHE